jgi:hypothetical protein
MARDYRPEYLTPVPEAGSVAELEAEPQGTPGLTPPMSGGNSGRFVCLVGGVVGFIVISMYRPMFDLYDRIH